MSFRRLHESHPHWSFRKFCGVVALAAGTAWAFFGAAVVVVVWLLAGFHFGFTNTFYQLLINTGTTIVTFLMVFLIQNQQNRDAESLHIKLDGLIEAMEGAPNKLIGIEHRDQPLDAIREEIEREVEAMDEK